MSTIISMRTAGQFKPGDAVLMKVIEGYHDHINHAGQVGIIDAIPYVTIDRQRVRWKDGSYSAVRTINLKLVSRGKIDFQEWVIRAPKKRFLE